jgi:Lrp/AsnC family transcriptional regulator, leucine-responsive regulatory protein
MMDQRTMAMFRQRSNCPMNAATFESKPVWDATDWQLLEALQQDARLGYAELGRKVRLSAPAVAERVKRLEEAGVMKSTR